MSDHPIPDARLEAPSHGRLAARLSPARRVLAKVIPTLLTASLIVGFIGFLGYFVYACCEDAQEAKVRECKALNWSRDHVERVVRTEDGVRVYVRDDALNPKFLREYAFGDRAPFSAIVFMIDVPEGQPMRFVSTAVLEPNEQCIQTTVFHIRSAKDIE
jgi:hypothetical protein